ncbi:MAG: iron-containing alcohol dehydrogenase [Geminicoccaceae bacterium]
MSRDFGGVLNELVAGRWRHPTSGRTVSVPFEAIVIRETLDGAEPDLLAEIGYREKALAVVSDRFTHDVLAGRVARHLEAAGFSVDDVVWQTPVCSDRGVEELRGLTAGAEALVAVGSGTINDSVKFAAFQDGKPFATFPTSPMTAHFAGSASVSVDGLKQSIVTDHARGVFVDLEVLCNCPKRLIWSAYADVVCRTTAQVDWLLSHRLLDTPYYDTVYHLLAPDETVLMESADAVAAGDIDAIARVTRMNGLMGLGTSFGKTTHHGSMAEHMLSHYIDMFAGDAHPGTTHGEQVGVATLTMNRLHHRILDGDTPPVLEPTVVDREAVEARFGRALAEACLGSFEAKRFDRQKIDALNLKLEKTWPALTVELRPLMLDPDDIDDALRRVGAPVSAGDLGLALTFWRDAIRYGRFTRDRYTMLDLAGDAGALDDFSRSCG